jgi:acetate kinase
MAGPEVTRDLGQIPVINCGSSSIKYQLLIMEQGEN